jgi:hypothetical protein
MWIRVKPSQEPMLTSRIRGSITGAASMKLQIISAVSRVRPRGLMCKATLRLSGLPKEGDRHLPLASDRAV